jgi:hypothetical protein
MQQPYDRSSEDLGNVIHFEHVNVTIPDQRLATLFYISGLGLTRDPYLNVSDSNMWVNVGRSQFHLPSGEPQRLRGTTGIVIAGRAALLDRLAGVKKKLAGTRFDFREHNDFVEAICPWGNRVRCHEPDAERFGRIILGIPYVEFEVAPGTAAAVAAFYALVIETPTAVTNGDARVARVRVGNNQHFLFRETDRPLPDYDGHHVAIYIADFSGPYRRLCERDLVCSEDNDFQYRFRDIVDPQTGKLLFAIEHEVRSLTHPMFLRPLVNRNPRQTTRTFSPGYDSQPWAMSPDMYDNRTNGRSDA